MPPLLKDQYPCHFDTNLGGGPAWDFGGVFLTLFWSFFESRGGPKGWAGEGKKGGYGQTKPKLRFSGFRTGFQGRPGKGGKTGPQKDLTRRKEAFLGHFGGHPPLPNH